MQERTLSINIDQIDAKSLTVKGKVNLLKQYALASLLGGVCLMIIFFLAIFLYQIGYKLDISIYCLMIGAIILFSFLLFIVVFKWRKPFFVEITEQGMHYSDYSTVGMIFEGYIRWQDIVPNSMICLRPIRYHRQIMLYLELSIFNGNKIESCLIRLSYFKLFLNQQALAKAFVLNLINTNKNITFYNGFFYNLGISGVMLTEVEKKIQTDPHTYQQTNQTFTDYIVQEEKKNIQVTIMSIVMMVVITVGILIIINLDLGTPKSFGLIVLLIFIMVAVSVFIIEKMDSKSKGVSFYLNNKEQDNK